MSSSRQYCSGDGRQKKLIFAIKCGDRGRGVGKYVAGDDTSGAE